MIVWKKNYNLYWVFLIKLFFCYCKDYKEENYENLSFGFGVFNIFGKKDVIWWYIFLNF